MDARKEEFIELIRDVGRRMQKTEEMLDAVINQKITFNELDEFFEHIRKEAEQGSVRIREISDQWVEEAERPLGY